MPPNDLVIEFVAIDPLAAEMPALLHPLKSTRTSRLLLRRQHALAAYWDKPGDRLAVAGDREFLAPLDFADNAGESLVGFAQRNRLGHDLHVARWVLHARSSPGRCLIASRRARSLLSARPRAPRSGRRRAPPAAASRRANRGCPSRGSTPRSAR